MRLLAALLLLCTSVAHAEPAVDREVPRLPTLESHEHQLRRVRSYKIAGVVTLATGLILTIAGGALVGTDLGHGASNYCGSTPAECAARASDDATRFDVGAALLGIGGATFGVGVTFFAMAHAELNDDTQRFELASIRF